MGHEYDSPWKEALARFFSEFLQLFFPAIHEDIDWSRGYRVCHSELAKLTPKSEQGHREADLLLQITRIDAQRTWVLVHLEVQNQEDPNFTERMLVYHYRIYDRYRKPVCSLAVLGDTNRNWRPCSHRAEVWGSGLNFRFLTAKLEDRRAEIRRMERSTNPFGPIVAAHLHTRSTGPDSHRRRRIKFRMIRQLIEGGFSGDEIYELLRLIDWLLTLSKRQAGLFREQIEEYQEETGMTYVTTFEQMGIEKGIALGREEGLEAGIRASILGILEDRFGIPVQVDLRGKSPEQLHSLVVAAARVSSLEEFQALL